MPAPAARMRSESVPCGTSSSSTLPERYASWKWWESTWRGYEQMSLWMRRALNSAAMPTSPFPALLFTIVRSFAPCAISASISSSGTPEPPKPPTRMVAPSRTSASAASMEGEILSTMPSERISRVECRVIPQREEKHGQKTPRGSAQPPLVRHGRPQVLRSPLAHLADGLRPQRLRGQARDRDHQHLERHQSLPRAFPRARR